VRISRYLAAHCWFDVLLWLTVPLPLLAQGLDAVAVGKVADVAREKDVVWLSLVVAIVAITFSAWLVKQLLNLAREQIEASLEQSEAIRDIKEKSDSLAFAKHKP